MTYRNLAKARVIREENTLERVYKVAIRTLPPCFGKWQEVYQCFSCWSKEGIFENIFSEASKAADTSEISIDSTFVKVHQHALSVLKKETV